jgi:hypothetical protein
MQNTLSLSLIVILVLSVVCSFLTASVLSQNTTSQTIQSQGEILYAPQPTPTPTPNPRNLAPVPDGWTKSITNQRGIGSSSSIVYPVYWQGRTAIRLDSDTDYIAIGWPDTNEINSALFSIKPGDHIVFKMWLWSESSTVGDDRNPYSGAMMGIDVYGNGRICGLTTPDGKCAWPDYTPAYTQNIVPFGSGEWIQKTMDFIVQDTYIADPFNPPSGHSAYDVVVPNGMIPTLTIYTHNTNTEKASIYLADTELYINP